MVLKAIIWDLDGTIIDFNIDFMRARKEVITIFKSCGVPRKILSIRSKISETVETSKKFLTQHSHSENFIRSVLNEVNDAVIQIETEAANNARMVKGIDEVLQFAKNNGLKQAIFTYNTVSNARLSLINVNLLNFFDIIAGRDSVVNPKPHPDHINYIMSILNVKPQETVVIGDTSRDIKAALLVGAYSIGLKTRIAKIFRDKIFDHANKIIDSREIPLGLINILQELMILDKNKL
jgi:phosphoglycolate phosphatase